MTQQYLSSEIQLIVDLTDHARIHHSLKSLTTDKSNCFIRSLVLLVSNLDGDVSHYSISDDDDDDDDEEETRTFSSEKEGFCDTDDSDDDDNSDDDENDINTENCRQRHHCHRRSRRSRRDDDGSSCERRRRGRRRRRRKRSSYQSESEQDQERMALEFLEQIHDNCLFYNIEELHIKNWEERLSLNTLVSILTAFPHLKELVMEDMILYHNPRNSSSSICTLEEIQDWMVQELSHGCPQLQKVSLNSCGPAENSLVLTFGRLSHVHGMTLQGLLLSEDTLHILFNQPNLKSLTLHQIPGLTTCPKSLFHFLQGLHCNSTLQELHLKDPLMTVDDLEHFCTVIKDSLSLSKVSLVLGCPTLRSMKDCANVMIQLMQTASHLEHFGLDIVGKHSVVGGTCWNDEVWNPLPPTLQQFACNIVNALQYNTTLRSLDLSFYAQGFQTDSENDGVVRMKDNNAIPITLTPWIQEAFLTPFEPMLRLSNDTLESLNINFYGDCLMKKAVGPPPEIQCNKITLIRQVQFFLNLNRLGRKTFMRNSHDITPLQLLQVLSSTVNPNYNDDNDDDEAMTLSVLYHMMRTINPSILLPFNAVEE